MEPIYHVPLQTKPIDPNKAKYWSLGLSVLGVLIAVWTFKSNYTYFAVYHEGWDFWLRIIGFVAIEITLILLPLFKGWGNPRQILAMWIFEIAIIVLSFVHTGYVNDSTQTRIASTRSKAEAKADFDSTSKTANDVADRNKAMRSEYNATLAQWRRAATVAQNNNQPPPPMPVEPQYLSVPQVSQKMVDTANLNIEETVETVVPHAFLLRLLQGMLLLVVVAWTIMLVLADSMRLRLAILRTRGQQLDTHISQKQEVRKLGEGSPTQTPVEQVEPDENPFPREIPENGRPNGPRR